MKVLYLDCFSGISGDMILGALLDAGLDIKVLKEQLAKLRLEGYEIKKRRVLRSGLAGLKFEVKVDSRRRRIQTPSYRSLKGIITLIDKSSLDKEVKENSKRIFQNLAKAERLAHGNKKDVHFHQIGAIDSIVDVVGSCIAIRHLRIDEVFSSIPNVGGGLFFTDSGWSPNPAPATLNLLKNRSVIFSDTLEELTTPTGAAILATLSKNASKVPPMRILKVGYGAGARKIQGRPNLLRAVIGQSCLRLGEEEMGVIQTNIDDMNPECFPHLFERLFEVGAVEAYLTPVQMKKLRPGILLTVLAAPYLIDTITSVIFEETSSFGLRYYCVHRRKLDRSFVELKTKYGKLKVKVGRIGGKIVTVSPEFEDCKRIAKSLNIPLKSVYDEARHKAKVKLA